MSLFNADNFQKSEKIKENQRKSRRMEENLCYCRNMSLFSADKFQKSDIIKENHCDSRNVTLFNADKFKSEKIKEIKENQRKSVLF